MDLDASVLVVLDKAGLLVLLGTRLWLATTSNVTGFVFMPAAPGVLDVGPEISGPLTVRVRGNAWLKARLFILSRVSLSAGTGPGAAAPSGRDVVAPSGRICDPISSPPLWRGTRF